MRKEKYSRNRQGVTGFGGAFRGKCEDCGKSLCAAHAYKHTDDSNGAITNGSPWLCAECYERRTGEHIPTDVERFKARLIERARKYAANGVDLGKLDVLEMFIRGS